MATAYALEQQKKREEEEAQSLQQAKNQAEVLNQQEADKKAQQWLEGQALLNAYIADLEQKGATPEQIAALQEQGATQGFGTAISNAIHLSQTLIFGTIPNPSSNKPLNSPIKDEIDPPSDKDNIVFLSITEQELAYYNNLNTIATITGYVGWFLAGELLNLGASIVAPSIFVPGAIIFGALGIGFGAFENSNLSFVQSELTNAVNNNTEVQVWRDPQGLVVYDGTGNTVTIISNSPVATGFVQFLVYLETGSFLP